MTPEMSPTWFQGFNLAFQIIFLLITIGISYKAYQTFRFFAGERHKFLSLGFAFFALSYVAAIVSSSAHIIGGAREVAVGLLFVHTYLFLAGVMIFLFLYLDIERPAVRAVLLVLVFGLIAILGPGGDSQEMIFHLLTAILMLFIVGQLTQGYKRTCKRSTLFVTLGFSFLTAGQLMLAFVMSNNLFFVAAALFTLAGFLSIAASRMLR